MEDGYLLYAYLFGSLKSFADFYFNWRGFIFHGFIELHGCIIFCGSIYATKGPNSLQEAKMRILEVFLSLTVLITVSLTASCRSDDNTGKVIPREIALAYARFGFDIYRAEANLSKGGNLFISPVSVAMALAMTMEGSDNATEEEISRVLGLSRTGREDVGRYNRQLMKSLQRDREGVEVSIANSLWLNKSYSFLDKFKRDASDYFLADLYPLTTAEKINSWVSEKTEKKIESIVDRVSSDDAAFLINAIYFNGKWKNRFDPELTESADFHTASGETKDVQMMKRKGSYLYIKNDLLEGVIIPYADEKTNIVLILPSEESGLTGFHEDLDYDSWKNLRSGFRKREGTVELPRLKIEYKTELKRQLASLGMKAAFSPVDADFTRMIRREGDRNLYIDEVLHKSFLRMDEEGTEAAAVTAVKMKLTSVAMPVEPFHLIFDRPYFLMIEESESGLPIFMGSITDPESPVTGR